MSEFHLLAPLSEPRRVCSALEGAGWLSTREARRDLARVLSLVDHEGAGADLRAPLLVVASDRYHMLLACLAAWCRERVVVLPPNHQAGSLQQARALSGATLELTDAALASCLASKEAPNRDPEDSLIEGSVIASDRELLEVCTSGTTGNQQACTKTAGQLLGEALMLGSLLGFDASRRVAATVPCHHLYGLLFSVLVPFFRGSAFVREPAFQPAQIQQTCERWQVTDLVTVPAHLKALVDAGWKPSFHLQRAFSSGTVLDTDLASEFRRVSGAEVVDVLGSTESGGIAWRVTEPGAVYVPLPGVEVAAAADARLRLRSPFLPPGSDWQLMNDRIRMVEGGFEHLGRNDGIVKLGGKRVAVQELEARARQLDAVSDAAVLVRPSTTLRGTELWLAVAAETGQWTPASLRQALGRYFDPVVLPRRYRVVPRLPRDALGKLQKERLERLFSQQPAEVDAIDESDVREGPNETRFTTDVFVPEHYPFFQGHFPGEPVLPGVAQLSEFVLPAISKTWTELATLERAPLLKYKRPIKPGARLALEVRRPHGAASVHFELREDGELCTTGQLCFAVPNAATSA
ncbi:MAG TPA: AMP-binding protein [Polyangiaceae bacterium]